jgi:tetratricopeptide (TPR) repeat protein
MPLAFISYSHKDEKIVDGLVEKLGKENILIDKFNLDGGDLLPSKLSENITDSNWFVLVASENSMKSRWVKYEVNQAIIKWIEKNDFNILVVKINECEVYPELKPFVYFKSENDSQQAIDKTVKFILSEGEGKVQRHQKWRGKVVNRYGELEIIEDLANEGIHFIFLWGLFGIGKTVLVEHIADKIFNLKLLRLPLTGGYNSLRLSLELASEAGIDLPAPETSEKDSIKKSVDAIIKLNGKGYMILFDDLENVIEEDGNLPDFLSDLNKKLVEIDIDIPIFFTSSRHPYIGDFIDYSNVLKIEGLKDEHVLYILENWIRLSGGASFDRDNLKELVPHLHGYPLAARLAAHTVSKYSIETVMGDTKYFKSLKLDIAKQLIGRVRSGLTEDELDCLGVLTVADEGLSLEEISIVLKVDIEKIRTAVDNLVSSLLVFYEKGRLQIIPLIKDYFWTRVNRKDVWKNIAEELVKESEFKLRDMDLDTKGFVHYGSMTYRLFILLGRHEDAKQLKYQFEGELRGAVMRLYNSKEYELALEYANNWLKVKSEDHLIRWYSVRCLTRLERYDDAEKELKQLEKLNYKPFKLYHAWGLIHRDKRNYEEAIKYFLKGLDNWPEYTPLLRDIGDVYSRLKDYPKAIEHLKQAYNIAPTDRFIVPKYVEVLEKKGNYEKALNIIRNASIAFPDEAIYQHKLSLLLQNLGNNKESYTHARNAYELDQKLNEAVLHLASLEIKNDNIKEAKRLLKELPSSMPKWICIIRDTVNAEILIKEKGFVEARKLISRYDYTEDPYLAEVLARVELNSGLESLSKKQKNIGCSQLRTGKDILNVTIARYQKNTYLQATLKQIDNALEKLCK